MVCAKATGSGRYEACLQLLHLVESIFTRETYAKRRLVLSEKDFARV